MAGAIFFMNFRDGACPSYYTFNVRYNYIAGGLLFKPPLKIIDALNVFFLYTFVSRGSMIRSGLP